jgi:hypothetical protein
MIRRILSGSVLVSAAALTAVGLPGIPAAGAPTPTVVVSRTGIPEPLVFTTDSTSCATSSQATATHVDGPGKPPLGTGSLRVTLDRKSAADLHEAPTGMMLADLTNFSLSSYLPKKSSATAQAVVVSTAVNADGDYYRITLALPTQHSAWSTTDVFASSSLAWQFIDPTSGVLDSGTSSYADFASAHPAGLSTVGIDFSNCGTGKQKIAVDDLTLGFDGTATSYDFEALIVPTLTNHASDTSIKAGHVLTLSTHLTTGKNPLGDQHVALLSRPAGASAYSQLLTVKTNAKGHASATQQPAVTTRYRWHFTGNATYASASSPTRAIDVATKVTMHLAHAKVSAGTPIDASGTVTPTVKGAKVVLWRKTTKGKAKIGHGKEYGDGTYSIAENLSVGHYTVWTTVKADKTNTRGHSHHKDFTVH